MTIDDGGPGHATKPDPGTTLEPFSQVSAVQAGPDGTFAAELSAEWTVGGRPSGGYLLALMARVASSLADNRDIAVASAHYLRSPEPGPVELEGEVIHGGRSLSHVRVRLNQAGRRCVEALMTAAELEPAAGPHWDSGVQTIPHVPFEECFITTSEGLAGLPVAMLDQVDIRLDPELRPIAELIASGRGRISGWMRLLGGEDFDPAALLWAVDALPPASFDTEVPAWFATVQMSVYIRARPAPGPIRAVTRARLIDPQWVDQTCDIWDSTGQLVAQATQFAKVFG